VTDGSAAPPLPSLEQARGWIGSALDDAGGGLVGRVEGVYADAADGRPVWLVVRIGRRRRSKTVVVPLRECAAMPGRVWAAEAREAIGGAPTVDPMRPLLGEHETAICRHYQIGEGIGRHAEVAGRAADTITAQPAAT
jgi:hypothetical protein